MEDKKLKTESEDVQNVSFTTSTVNIPSEYKPISMWGYFGYELLFSIPCIGFILLCVFAFGGTQNINLKNFARSYFCFLIIGLILGAIVLAFLAVFGIFAAGTSGAIGSGSFGSAVEQSAMMP